MGDFNDIKMHFEAFDRSSVPMDMEEFDMAICEAYLVEPIVQGNQFTWTRKVHGFGLIKRFNRILVNGVGLLHGLRVFLITPLLFYPNFQQRQWVVSFCFFNHWVEDSLFIDVVSLIWSRHVGVSLIVSFVRNLHNHKPTLHIQFGKHIQSLSEEVRIAKESMDKAQRKVGQNPMSDVLSRQAGLAILAF